MKNVVIITAKGGNQSLHNKNIIPIMGNPIMVYPIRAARNALTPDGVFVTTEDDFIKNIAVKEHAKVIDRPASLSTPESEHKDVIRHAVQALESEHPELENVVVLLGNTVMVTPGLIDRAFEALQDDNCDSIVSVWTAQDDHPYRALKISDEGYVDSFLGNDVGSNRQSYPTAYYYDQGIWGFKKECAVKQEGPKPWVWLGARCKAIVRPWVTGRDVHGWIDIAASIWYLNSIQAYDFVDYEEDH